MYKITENCSFSTLSFASVSVIISVCTYNTEKVTRTLDIIYFYLILKTYFIAIILKIGRHKKVICRMSWNGRWMFYRFSFVFALMFDVYYVWWIEINNI